LLYEVALGRQTVSRTINLRAPASSIVVDTVHNRLYAATTAIEIFDLSSLKPTGAVPITYGTSAYLRLSPSGQRLYIAEPGALQMRVVDTTSLLDVASVTNLPNAGAVAVMPDGSKAFISYGGFGWYPGVLNYVGIVDGFTNQLTSSIEVGPTSLWVPQKMAMSADGSQLYVAGIVGDEYGITTTVIDPVQQTLLGYLPRAVPFGYALALTADNKTLVMGNYDLAGGIGMIDVSQNAPIGVIPSGSWPSAIATYTCGDAGRAQPLCKGN